MDDGITPGVREGGTAEDGGVACGLPRGVAGEFAAQRADSITDNR
jgi:hypothetical protein